MIIEFAGTPGAGKSTFGAILQQSLGELGLRGLSRDEARRRCFARTWLGRLTDLVPGSRTRALFRRLGVSQAVALSALAFMTEHTALIWHVLASQSRRRAAWSQRWIGVRRFFRDAAHHRMLRRGLGPGEAVVFDEGFVQRVVSLYVSPSERARESDLVDYLRRVPRSDAVVLVRAPAHECRARIAARGLPKRVRQTTGAELGRFLDNAAESVDFACRWLEVHDWTVVVVDNSAALETSGSELRDRFGRVARRHGAESER